MIDKEFETELKLIRQDLAWIKDFLLHFTGRLPFETRKDIWQKPEPVWM